MADSNYQAPLRDARFLLHEVFAVEQYWPLLPGGDAWSVELIATVLDEVGRLCSEVLAPLNQRGDQEGVKLENGEVRTPKGFRKAYRTLADNSWLSLHGNPRYGAQGMSQVVDVLTAEFYSASNIAFSLYIGLTGGAAHTLDSHATEQLNALCLPRMYSGEWSGCMCLTEAHAGTDLGMIRSRATPAADGEYRISGTKIFITAGEHDLSDNILYLVLAKLPDAPPGSRGISLFLAPKFLIAKDGTLGERNEVHCLSLEDKMGIHASSTCVMQFEEARGYLVGRPHEGLACMFTMMNRERLFVGMQGLGCSTAAYQKACAYARERIQGRAATGAVAADSEADPIIVHPDVRRMLLTQRAFIEGGRAFAVYLGLQMDLAAHGSDKEQRARAEALVALFTPVAKAFMTDKGFECCVLAQQVFGGHGYIRDWGLEQLVRDVRITQIYEGTNGVQALDFAGRKVARTGGRLVQHFVEEARAFFAAAQEEEQQPYIKPAAAALDLLKEMTGLIVARAVQNPEEVGAASVEYLHLCGYAVYAYMWARMALVSLQQRSGAEADFHTVKLQTADFFLQRLLPQTTALAAAIRAGSATIMAPEASSF